MADRTCVGCGATDSGLFVCHHCGVAFEPLIDVESQRQALEELHGQLAFESAPPNLLKNAFLPDDPRILIDAGLRLLPVIENAAGQRDAAGRMRAIIIKLRLLGDDPTISRAAKELEAALAAYERSDRQMGVVLTIVFTVVIVGIGLGIKACT